LELRKTKQEENEENYTRRTSMCKGKKEGKAVPLHVMEALGGRGGIAPTHSRLQH
jgi:hypothetical protein